MVGRTLGHYEIIEPLGAGGMGEVYRAHDTTLKRDVAIKVLPEDLSSDVERLARLEREAQLLAALNHSNIATIHGLEDALAEDGTRTRFLVMELIEGESLAEALTRGRIDVEKALDLARLIAEALEAAHAKGIIHRDLKPGNVVITPDGQAKVLDFGLAKSDEAGGIGADVATDITESPTVTAATRAGIILGTAAYMSPEQARGKPLDKRTDIWSFGCVVFEMLTGKKPFEGETVTDVLAAIVGRVPDWDAVPSEVPVLVQVMLRRCLKKDRRKRLHDIADARIEIVEALSTTDGGLPGVAPAAGQHAPSRRAMQWGLAGVVVGAIVAGIAVWGLMRSVPPVPQPVVQFSLELPPDVRLKRGHQAVAISPDGIHLAFATTSRLYVRALDDPVGVVELLRGAEGIAGGPFFSSDSQWLGFWAEGGELRKVPINGGAAVGLCEALSPTGATWADGQILYGQGAEGIWRVSAEGGEPEQVIALSAGEEAHGPQLLPDGDWVLYTLLSGGKDWNDAEIVLQSLTTDQRRVLVSGGKDARYLATGHIVYASGNVLLARPFELSSLEVGGAVSIIEGLRDTTEYSGSAHFSFSHTGTLAYVPSAFSNQKLVWVDRQGASVLATDRSAEYRAPRFSPDGERVAVELGGEQGRGIWVLELQEGILTRLTTEVDVDPMLPVWSLDGERLIYTAQGADARQDIFSRAADFSADTVRILDHEYSAVPMSISSSGQLAFYEIHPGEQRNILALPADGGPPGYVVRSPHNERSLVVSPDGHWGAYVSDRSGSDEVYVEPFPNGGRRRQVSDGGGREPLWAPEGHELFYRNGEAMIAVPVTTDAEFDVIGERRTLFEDGSLVTNPFVPNYDIHPDGQRFLMVAAVSGERINIVLNWLEEWKRRAPAVQ